MCAIHLIGYLVKLLETDDGKFNFYLVVRRGQRFSKIMPASGILHIVSSVSKCYQLDIFLVVYTQCGILPDMAVLISESFTYHLRKNKIRKGKPKEKTISNMLFGGNAG